MNATRPGPSGPGLVVSYRLRQTGSGADDDDSAEGTPPCSGRSTVCFGPVNQFLADGRTLGYELRDLPGFASMREDPRFVKLRQRAEAWAAALPDPPD